MATSNFVGGADGSVMHIWYQLTYLGSTTAQGKTEVGPFFEMESGQLTRSQLMRLVVVVVVRSIVRSSRKNSSIPALELDRVYWRGTASFY